jgi:hypothetical protein
LKHGVVGLLMPLLVAFWGRLDADLEGREWWKSLNKKVVGKLAMNFFVVRGVCESESYVDLVYI